ncbi:hypothetical protein EWM64_g7969 [Hericium alpestre]|uniref:F-box domain-containing protein n=1 Tax=Hericium alpestre TaxID=135208 RepID=A0A4Y9ZP56_9AGAM|nr:hypothetical protein EWM64_g7969 [Hericium alpestre]
MKIFKLSFPDIDRGESRQYHASGWLTIVGVCRYWRAVAFSAGIFWTDIVFHPMRCAEVMLERAGSAPLSIYYNFGWNYVLTASDEETVELALRQMHHVQDIELHGPGMVVCSLTQMMTQPAPILQSLKLVPNTDLGGLGRSMLSNELFSGQAPQLRSLDLSMMSISMASPVLTHLSYLSLLDIPVKLSFTEAELLTRLQSLPQLECLRIRYVFPGPPSSAGTQDNLLPKGLVTLPNLAKLSVCSSSLYSATVMRYLEVPSSTKMWLGVSDKDLSIIAPIAPQFIDPFGRPPIDRVDIIFEASNGSWQVKMRAFPDNDATDDPHAFTFVFSAYVPPRKQCTTIGMALQNLSLSSVRMLRITLPETNSSRFHFESEGWHMILQHFTALEDLELCGTLSFEIGIALVRRSGQYEPATAFPALHTLRIPELHFKPNDSLFVDGVVLLVDTWIHRAFLRFVRQCPQEINLVVEGWSISRDVYMAVVLGPGDADR